jgi:hypothetical protein
VLVCAHVQTIIFLRITQRRHTQRMEVTSRQTKLMKVTSGQTQRKVVTSRQNTTEGGNVQPHDTTHLQPELIFDLSSLDVLHNITIVLLVHVEAVAHVALPVTTVRFASFADERSKDRRGRPLGFCNLNLVSLSFFPFLSASFFPFFPALFLFFFVFLALFPAAAILFILCGWFWRRRRVEECLGATVFDRREIGK